ncbi:jg22722 [Pararge aegeria aegeria]|uniref:Jg22722 protein n=1 Tax=Pararge aegeria aegeria TaxID=348720 RepID=A0A8S4QT07_9NEOP|nr:jg22722 [Pararge aegeria aegeria]
MEINIKKRYCWPDSRTVLAWIKSDPRTFKTFVAHRLAEIEEFSKTSGWSYVPTKQTTFGSNHWWFNGPEFLKLDCNKWPKDHSDRLLLATGKEKTQTVATARHIQPPIPDVNRFSSWTLYLRASGFASYFTF